MKELLESPELDPELNPDLESPISPDIELAESEWKELEEIAAPVKGKYLLVIQL